MIEICDRLLAPLHRERRAVDKMEAEHRRRETLAQIRREEAAERQRRDSEALTRREEEAQLAAGRLRDLQSRLARGGDGPSLADVDLVTTMHPLLRRGGAAYLLWSQFADQDPCAAAELCQRLALIARADQKPLDRADALAAALADAGFNPPDPAPLRPHRQRPMEASPHRLSKCKAALASLQTWRLPNGDDPAVQQMLRRMGE